MQAILKLPMDFWWIHQRTTWGEVNIIDQSGKWIAPGLVDTHIHGYMNHDVMDNDAEGIKVMSEGLLSCGVTSFYQQHWRQAKNV